MTPEVELSHKVAQVIRALLDGVEVTLNGQVWSMCDSYDLCSIAYKDDGDKVFLRSQASLSAFIRLVEGISEAEFVGLIAGITLRSLKTRRLT